MIYEDGSIGVSILLVVESRVSDTGIRCGGSDTVAAIEDVEALTLQQCLFGETEERYHQLIDRSGLTPATRLQRSVGERYSKTPFSSLRDAANYKHAG
ncbi:hypothetical protein TNCV_3132011 [Trichonephila clavipes]|uniref:Uncharacterized protein n=1 Tax=Trichonephila clavipes TaxID=2585209 RepID=A0A8X6VD17_TRICX|nr:hypothetical protein TNCV_3132011 [Trichonephila clavipes]